MSKSIYALQDYGRMVITLKDAVEKEGISRNKLATLTGCGNNLVKRYYFYEEKPISSVDLDVLAKMCYVLKCDITDLLKYEIPKTAEDVIVPESSKKVAEKKNDSEYKRRSKG